MGTNSTTSSTTPPQSPAAPPRYRWVIFGILTAAYIVVFLHHTCPAVVALDIMKDLHAGGTLMGLLASSYFYSYALMQLPAGLLADGWGPRKSITLFFILTALGSLGFGLAATPGQAVAARVLVGLGVAMVFVPSLKIFTHWFPPSEFAWITGAFISLGSLGIFSASQPLALLSQAVGWRMSFEIIAVLTLVITVGIWVLVRDTPAQMGLASGGAVLDGPPPPSGPRQLLRGVGQVLTTPRFWPVALWCFMLPGCFFSLAGLWGGPFLIQVYGLDKSQAGTILAMNSLAMVLGSLGAARLSQRLRSRRKVLVGAAVLAVVLAAAMVLAPSGWPLWALYPWFFLFTLANNSPVGVAFTNAKELFPTAMAGTSVGVVNLFTFLGGALMQPAAGWMLERAGHQGAYTAGDFRLAFGLYLVAAVSALAASFLCRETFHSPAR